MDCNFKIGQAVVCIEDDWKDAQPRYTMPKRGKVYTIRDFIVADIVGLRFVEIVNPAGSAYVRGREGFFETEPSFHYTAFRPLDEIDISIFTNMLKAKPKGSLKERIDALNKQREREGVTDPLTPVNLPS